MYARNELASIMALNNCSGRQLAKVLNIGEKAMYSKMKDGKFTIPEAQKIKDLFNLDMEKVGQIFFANLPTASSISKTTE